MTGKFPEPQRTDIAELLIEAGHPLNNIGLFLCELDGVWTYHAYRKRAADGDAETLKELLERVQDVVDHIARIARDDPELVNCVLLGYGHSDTSIGEHLPSLSALRMAVESAIHHKQRPAHRNETLSSITRAQDIITRAYASRIAVPVATTGRLFERVLQLVRAGLGVGHADSTVHNAAASIIKSIKNS